MMSSSRGSWRPFVTTLVPACLTLAGLASCGRATSDSGRSSAEVTALAGRDVHVLGTSDSVASVYDLEPLSNGDVWVLNSAQPFFVGFGPDGHVLHAYGRRGGGPLEFEDPAGFVEGGIGGQAWMFDLRRHAMVEVSRPGSARAEIALPRSSIPAMSVMTGHDLLTGHVVRIERLGDEIILPRRSNPPGAGVASIWLSIWTADLVALDPRTDSVRTVVSLAEVLGDPTSHYDLTGVSLPFPMWYRLWAVCGNELRVYDRFRDEIHRFEPDGTELEPISLPVPPRKGVTREGFLRLMLPFAMAQAAGAVSPSGEYAVSAADSARILNSLRSRVTAPPDQLSNLLPIYTDLRCDEKGTMWMQPFDIGAGGLDGGPNWLRIAPDGAADRVRLPDRFDPYRFTSRRIWGVQRSELDVASVAWIAVP